MYEKYYNIFLKSGIVKKIDIFKFDQMLQETMAQCITYKKDAIIKADGQPCTDIGLVLEGEALMAKNKGDGNRAIIEVIRPGCYFGEGLVFSSASTAPKWPVTVQARTECTVLLLDNDWMLGRKPMPYVSLNQILLNMIGPICDRSQRLLQALRCFHTRSIRERIAVYLLEKVSAEDGSVTLDFNRDEWADYLFIPRPSLSRELSKMKEDGLIDFYKSTFHILNKEALMQYLQW